MIRNKTCNSQLLRVLGLKSFVTYKQFKHLRLKSFFFFYIKRKIKIKPWTLFTATTVHPGFPGKSSAKPLDTTPNAPRPIIFSTFNLARGISHSGSPENDKL